MTLDEVERAHVQAVAPRRIRWRCRVRWHEWAPWTLVRTEDLIQAPHRTLIVGRHHYYRRQCWSCGRPEQLVLQERVG